MQVDLTFEPESLPACIRPKVMVAPGTLRSILWLTQNKGPPPQKKAWPGLTLSQESTWTVMVSTIHETRASKPMDLANDTSF